ncbi:restriction endonuclease subunit S [Desulfocicer vacuolatum]|nr:restriction endonuclease subunit S [Desulfocicer vacuolatum]
MENPEGKFPAEFDTYQVVNPGDFIFCMFDVEETPRAVGLSTYYGMITGAYTVLVPFKGNNKTFLYYFYLHLDSHKMMKPLYRGLRNTIPKEHFFSFKTYVPPLDEQTTIANFLDCKTAKIDQAVAIKEKQIQLLKERKQILIQDAVTKGLDPDVSMCDSGVEWIGEVPRHWGIKRFKYLFSQSNLPTRPDDGMVTSYRDGQVTLRSKRRLTGYTEAILEQGYQGIRKGQLVLNSMDAFEGAIGVSDSDGKCTPEYVICDPMLDDLLPEYFAFLLREMALSKYIQVICNAVRQRAVRIRFNNLKKRFLIVPPIKEQKAIVSHIQTQSVKIDKAITIQEQMIEKLKEYKATLINSAVTGKIKVPGAGEQRAVA